MTDNCITLFVVWGYFYSLYTALFGIWDYFLQPLHNIIRNMGLLLQPLHNTMYARVDILILCLSFSQLTYSYKHWPHAINLLQWFPKHQTFAVGLTMAGFGGSGIAFNQIITSYINPDNLSPDYITEDGERLVTWPRHFIIFESFCL